MNLKHIIPLCVIILICGSLAMCGHDSIKVNSTSIASTIKSDNPNVKVFIENSGSMDGYMCDGSKLKDAIYDYVSDINRYSDTTELYYINSSIIPYNGNLNSYIKDLNPASFRQAGGNRANSDMGNIIAQVLGTVNENTVAVFVSDCILDLPSKDAKDFLTNCEIRIKNEVINAQKKLPNLGIEILKLYSDFNGNYYNTDGSVEVLNNARRPYYIWIIGDKNYLAKLNLEVPLSLLNKYDLNGTVSFTNESGIPFEIKNKALTGNTIKSRSGGYTATILVDLRTTLQPESVITDKGNYGFNNSNIVIDGVNTCSDKNKKYTHFITFKIPDGTQIAEECLTFYKPKLASWVSDSNDETGDNVKSNLDKTTGIKYLIQGVADAYRDEKACAKMNFNVKLK